ncbi:hypothetical protein E5161_10210 [Cohnella pontilimi]|uniref:Copper-containing nitrite reductase n=1 Tax=Cohnella pontilimi TaxID=2564100 RepID=A0A4U0FCA7_9BACL|nr:multicopper oxidase domain-containing protein [Cohnella pontilimi]TJY42360.1 hypothetical protein E5161_10210 [Cohnella pontilimi]
MINKKWPVTIFLVLMALVIYTVGGITQGGFSRAEANESGHGSAHQSGDVSQAGEGDGIAVLLNGRQLPRPATVSSDFSETRISAQDVADALGYGYRWDATARKLYIEDKEIPAAADPIMVGSVVMVLADEYAQALSLSCNNDSASHRVLLETPQAMKRFADEEPAVRDVMEGKGMTPHTAADGTKEFTLTAELADWAPAKGVLTTAWTYNGQAPGPTIRVTEGDKVRIHFVNHLPEPSAIHWHGLHLPNAMDGVPGLTQKEVQPGQSFVYEFTASHPGTFMYHSHYNDMKQIGGGMYGAFIIDPKEKPAAAPEAGELRDGMTFDRDYTMLLAGNRVNNAAEDVPDYFTINGRSYPDTPPIEMRKGQTARIRLINIDTMEMHTMHLHGMDFQVIARNGHAVKTPETMNTVLLGPGETVDIAFRADAVGDWMFHCHILDHTMNGGEEHARTGSEMGGLITLVKILP